MIYYQLAEHYMAPLEGSEREAETWTRFVNRQLTTEFLHTGSQPMREIDVRKQWEEERAAGDTLFGVWSSHPNGGVMGARFIGTCGLHSFRWVYRSAEHRYLIFDPDFVGKGIGTALCKMLLWHGFKRLNLHRQWLGVSAKNERAIACYTNCGFKQEGRLRDDLFVMGEYVDAIRMSVLKKDWNGEDPRSK